MKRIKGKSVLSEIVKAEAFLYKSNHQHIQTHRKFIKDVEKEIFKFNNALKKSRAQLKKILIDLQKIGNQELSLIIDSQLMILKDQNFLSEIKELIKKENANADWAIQQVEKKYLEIFQKIPDLTIKERSKDISDLLRRILGNLSAYSTPDNFPQRGRFILVADDLTPSEAAKFLAKKSVAGLVLNQGGETAHTVILARSVGIPTIFATENATEHIQQGDTVIIDGISGEVIINPTKIVVDEISIKKNEYKLYFKTLKSVKSKPDLTRDNYSFSIFANIDIPFEAEMAIDNGAKGIGLFRTEFFYLNSFEKPDEESQFLVYKDLARKLYPLPLVIRTFDLGRDKIEAQDSQKEENPSLGMMAIRFFLKNRSLLEKQLKAIIRANQFGNIRILFPMVTEIEEIFTLKKIILEIYQDLINRKKIQHPLPQIGIMIEIPAIVHLIPYLKDEVDFFSIGTNDLIQYLLAVDRNNRSLSYLYSCFHPAVIKTLQEIYLNCRRIKKNVTICGEMASNNLTSLLLLGIGFNNFSMNPQSIFKVKNVFINTNQKKLNKIIEKLFTLRSKDEIEKTFLEGVLKTNPRLDVEGLL